MSQGFVNNSGLALPLAVASGGTGQTASTGTGAVVLTASPTITTPNIVGTSTNNNASAGSVGEFTSSVIAAASAVSMTTNTAMDVTSISLTAGDWDVYGNVGLATASVAATLYLGWISTTSASAPDQSLYNSQNAATAIVTAGNGLQVPFKRISISGTTTVYLSAFGTFAGTASSCGGIFARRVR